jgi:hypothetical protein
VSGNRLRDDELLARVKAEALGDSVCKIRRPLALRPDNFETRRSAKMNARLECIDSETNRSEPSAKIPGEIEKAQVETRRGRNLNAFQLRLFSSIHSSFAA